jgi:hypothetical protein
MISAFEALAQHRLLDRLIRGRTWIAIVAFALIGIVTLQLGLLKLNGGIGRALEHEAVLQRQNATLAIENSELAAGTRVERRAAQLGMGFVGAGALRFLSSSAHGDIAKAATALSTATQPAAVEGGESAPQGGESSEAQSGTEAEASASSESSESSAGAESSGESEASSSVSGEAASGESSAGSESTQTESSAAASGESESAASASAQTGAGGGIQATSTGE